MGVVNEVNDNLTAPAVSAGARHSPAVVVDEVNDNFIAPVESTGARYGPVEGANDGPVVEGSNIKQECVVRTIRTPRRRLISETVFDKMMLKNFQTPRNRSKSLTVRPRGAGKTQEVPSNQTLISSFVTPKRGKTMPKNDDQ